MSESHAKLYFSNRIMITAEHAADVLDISIEKADQLLSRPDTYGLLQKSLESGLQEALLQCLQGMVRIPHETVPLRVDCAVVLPSLQLFGKGL